MNGMLRAAVPVPVLLGEKIMLKRSEFDLEYRVWRL